MPRFFFTRTLNTVDRTGVPHPLGLERVPTGAQILDPGPTVDAQCPGELAGNFSVILTLATVPFSRPETTTTSVLPGTVLAATVAVPGAVTMPIPKDTPH